jgi:hypothetical protein
MGKAGQWEGNGRLLYAFNKSHHYHDVHDFAELFSAETELTSQAEARFQAVTPDTLGIFRKIIKDSEG